MGASSVTGKGVGSVDKLGGGKGPGNLRTNSVPMNGPHVVACGMSLVTPIQAQGTPGILMLPNVLPLPSSYYALFVSAVDNITFATPVFVESENPHDPTGPNCASGFVLYFLNGPGRVYWMVVKQGFGLELQTG